jgi:hypothetical protein
MKRVPALVLLACFPLTSCGRNYSNGSRIGIVTKLSEKGVIWKSWEGEMLMALPPQAAASGAQPEKFEFNVDPETVEKVKEAMNSGRRVELVYRSITITSS